MKLTVLVEDSASSLRRDLVAKRGLSILVEGEGDGNRFSLLTDTGPSPDIVLHNAEATGVDLSKISAVFLSHGHYDHTGGLIGILEHIDKRIPVIVHPKVFGLKLKIEPRLTLEQIYLALKEERYPMAVSGPVAEKARLTLERMFEDTRTH